MTDFRYVLSFGPYVLRDRLSHCQIYSMHCQARKVSEYQVDPHCGQSIGDLVSKETVCCVGEIHSENSRAKG